MPSKAEIAEAYKHVLRQRLKASLHDFVQYFWGVVVPQDKFQDNWHIRAMCDHLQALAEGRLDRHRLLIFLPPRHAKSIIINVFMPAWDWISRPTRRFLTSAGKANLSERDATKARDLIASVKYQALFGDIVTPADPNRGTGAWGKGYYQNQQGGHRLAITTSGGTGQDADFLLCDDPLEAQDSRSQTMRDSVDDWFNYTFTTRGVQAEKTPLVLVHQRLHEDDIAGRILANPEIAKLYDVLCFPARYETNHPIKTVSSLGFVDPRTKDGELLWPERFGEEWAIGEANKGARHYASQLQQRPSVAEGDIFDERMFLISHESMQRVVQYATQVVLSIDASFAKSDTSDYVAIICFARYGGEWYCVNGVNKKMSFIETMAEVREMMRQYRPTQILVESAANGQAIIDSLRNTGVDNVLAIKPNGGKEARAEACTSVLATYDVEKKRYTPTGVLKFLNTPFLDMLIDQALKFPHDKHDDMVDALTQFVNARLNRRQAEYRQEFGGF